MDHQSQNALGTAVTPATPRIRATDIAVLLLAVTVTVACTMMLRTAQQLAEISEANARQSQMMLQMAGKVVASTHPTHQAEPAHAMQNDPTPRD